MQGGEGAESISKAMRHAKALPLVEIQPKRNLSDHCQVVWPQELPPVARNTSWAFAKVGLVDQAFLHATQEAWPGRVGLGHSPVALGFVHGCSGYNFGAI